jgi:hypothetical protein
MQNRPAVPGFDGVRQTPHQAVAAFCRECFGGPAGACASSACLFWAYRLGNAADGPAGRLVAVIRRYCEGCLAPEDPAGCTAGRADRMCTPCPCWPYRMGRNPYQGGVRRPASPRTPVRQLELTAGQVRPASGGEADPEDRSALRTSRPEGDGGDAARTAADPNPHAPSS